MRCVIPATSPVCCWKTFTSLKDAVRGDAVSKEKEMLASLHEILAGFCFNNYEKFYFSVFKIG